ncbi:hypothetical protein OG730_34900 [Streptomyces sp. NBC_01298]|uniref:hypothetical protein n=1 Tax=Streptomyces sp. NBC_01298 TaxID=2903817 RepID=UPI002E10A5E7|nr:hypothetical protein OG730_34900 [Streptomyces sp. NBC_01298]
MSIDTTPIDWDLSKVIPGQLVTPEPADDEDDIAPGVLEVRPSHPLVLRKAGGAAMVVAAVTGKAIGITARATLVGSVWFGAGFKAGCVLGWRYLRAHDHQEVLGGMKSGTDWNRVTQTRKARWRFLGWATVVTPIVDLLGWWAITAWAGIPADYSWPILPGLEVASAVTAITAYGRYRLRAPDIAPGQVVADMDNPESDEPYPLAWCDSPGRVEECVSRALYAEGVDTRSVRYLGAHRWGHEVDIVLKGSTAGKVSAVADQLDSHFNIKKGGTLIDPDPSESAHITLRLVTGNPFADMPKPTPHPPNSLDISHVQNYGRCMDGGALDLVLEGVRTLVIGVSGAAKTTGVLRDLAEVITACHNAIALDLDPVKDGLREFEGVMAAPPIRGTKNCEKWLGYLVKMAEARNLVRNRLNMGDTWVATYDHPAIFPIVDEFIYLSQKGKELFIQLLRLGKQSGIYPIAAGQDATSDALGDAIADSFTLRVMLSSREEDIRLVLGSGAKAAGFRPDRLEPAQNKDLKNDAGQSYIKGAGLTRPLLYGWNEHSNQNIKMAVADRKAAGRPWFDRDTLAAAGLLKLVHGGATADASDANVIADAISVMADADVDRMRTETLVEALAGYSSDAYGELDASGLRKMLREAGADAPVTLGDLDGLKNPRGYKVETLTALL